jgi:gas vesicle protein
MATKTASPADDIAESIRSMVDRLVDAKITHEMARRGAEATELANEAWRDTKPMRRDAAKAIERASKDAAKWSRKTLRPWLKDVWNRRTLAIGAVGAAVPAAREVVDTAAVRLGVKEKEERHWGAFFLGLLFGIAAGAVAAMLTTPKPGSEMRRELGERADELATRAKDEWVPIFERATSGNGHVEQTLDGVAEGAAEAGSTAAETAGDAVEATSEAASSAADATAEAINDAYDSAERETQA